VRVEFNITLDALGICGFDVVNGDKLFRKRLFAGNRLRWLKDLPTTGRALALSKNRN